MERCLPGKCSWRGGLSISFDMSSCVTGVVVGARVVLSVADVGVSCTEPHRAQYVCFTTSVGGDVPGLCADTHLTLCFSCFPCSPPTRLSSLWSSPRPSKSTPSASRAVTPRDGHERLGEPRAPRGGIHVQHWDHSVRHIFHGSVSRNVRLKNDGAEPRGLRVLLFRHKSLWPRTGETQRMTYAT